MTLSFEIDTVWSYQTDGSYIPRRQSDLDLVAELLFREYDVVLLKPSQENNWTNESGRKVLTMNVGKTYPNVYWEEVSRQTVKFVET